MNELAPTEKQIKDVLQVINLRARSDPNLTAVSNLSRRKPVCKENLQTQILRTSMATHLATKYADLAIEYYIAARYSAIAGLSLVPGVLYHHAVEMIMKARLCEKHTTEELKKWGHKVLEGAQISFSMQKGQRPKTLGQSAAPKVPTYHFAIQELDSLMFELIASSSLNLEAFMPSMRWETDEFFHRDNLSFPKKGGPR
jgi:hypothetical protein